MTEDNQGKPTLNTLAALRKARGLTTVDVAGRMGTNRQRVSHIEAKFPKVHYDTLARYMAAIEGEITFSVGNHRVKSNDLIPDPEKTATREYLASRPGMGNLVYVKSGATEELPLQEGTPKPGSDDTGRDVDEGNPEGDQSDREDREES